MNSTEAIAGTPAEQVAAPSAAVMLKARPEAPEMAAKLAKQGIHPRLASLFAARGVTDASEVRATLTDALPYQTMKNCAEMAAILADCVDSQQRVLVVSDYDCDGATACAVLVSAFRACGMNADYLVPDRRKHGYGLTETIINDEVVNLAIKPDYIVTVDNGISSFAGIERARQLGIEVLVTDHHLPGNTLPNARLIVNPNQPGDHFESKHIAGCGVAWYVARALAEELRRRGKVPGYDPAALLPLVALGTVADVVRLDTNNRILVAEGLRRIRRGECTAGFKALAAKSGKQTELMSCVDFGFALAPRVNAAGRLEHMACGIELLLTEDEVLGAQLAGMLDEINIVRKEMTKTMAGEAERIVQALEKKAGDTMSVVVFGPEWHEGVIGIVAGRIKENRNRPCFVLCQAEDGSVKGSGRSIDGLHMKHVLDKIDVEHPGILLKFGGHGMAAGVTIAKERIDEFRRLFEQECRVLMRPEHLQRVMVHDGGLDEEDMTIATIKAINREVWGQGFERPLFIDTFEVVGGKTMGDMKQHAKLNVQKGDVLVDAVAFEAAHLAVTPPARLTVVYEAQINSYRGNEAMQVMVAHVPDQSVALTLVAAASRAKPPAAPGPQGLPEGFAVPGGARRGGFRRL